MVGVGLKMLTSDQIRAALSLRTYKEGWRWELHQDPYEGPYIRFLVDVPDALNGDQPTTLGINSWLPPMQTLEQLDHWMIWRIGRIENHEAREFYQDHAGHPVFDPHAV